MNEKEEAGMEQWRPVHKPDVCSLQVHQCGTSLHELNLAMAPKLSESTNGHISYQGKIFFFCEIEYLVILPIFVNLVLF